MSSSESDSSVSSSSEPEDEVEDESTINDYKEEQGETPDDLNSPECRLEIWLRRLEFIWLIAIFSIYGVSGSGRHICIVM